MPDTELTRDEARIAWLNLMIPQLLAGGFRRLAAEYSVERDRLVKPTIELRPVHPDLPDCYAVIRNGEDLGLIEQYTDGTWIGDVTEGNGPPSRHYPTRDEAVAYVVNCGDRG